MKSFTMTQATYDKLQITKTQLEAKLNELTQEIATARERGDLRENAEYKAAREADHRNREEYNRVLNKLRNALVIDINNIDLKDSIIFGCTVLLFDHGSNKEVVYTILGEEEANIFENKISYQSPLGMILMGKKKNDILSYTTPNGTKTVTIKDIYIL